MSPVTKLEPRSMVARLVLTIAGVLLMIAPAYAFQMLNLTYRFQNTMIALIELASLIVGFLLLYLGLKERESRERES